MNKITHLIIFHLLKYNYYLHDYFDFDLYIDIIFFYHPLNINFDVDHHYLNINYKCCY